MYKFILWMCISTHSCPMWESKGNIVYMDKAKDKQECEQMWIDSLQKPDPEGYKSYHTCTPIDVDL